MPEGEFEHSEVIMYHAMLLEEWGQFERCLEFLGENSQAIVDRTGFATQRGGSKQRPRLLRVLTQYDSTTALQAWTIRTSRMGVVSSRRRKSRFVRVHQGLRCCSRWRLWYASFITQIVHSDC